jgi:hypothetical protein
VVEMDTSGGNLVIRWTPGAYDDSAEEIRERAGEVGYDAAFWELLEEPLGNGWESIAPEDLGALTDAPILGYDVLRAEDLPGFEDTGTPGDGFDRGRAVVSGKIYWFPNYMVEDYLETLLTHGSVSFERAEDEEEEG